MLVRRNAPEVHLRRAKASACSCSIMLIALCSRSSSHPESHTVSEVLEVTDLLGSSKRQALEVEDKEDAFGDENVIVSAQGDVIQVSKIFLGISKLFIS